MAAPAVSTDRGCYLVGQTVNLSGQGFTPHSTYVVTVDGVYLGQRGANAHGNFSIPLHPGGLPAGAAQHVDHVEVSDGSSTGTTNFTVTRPAGARILPSGSNVRTAKARFQVWGFALGGGQPPIYVHYVDPAGKQEARTFIGRTGGQCGNITSPLIPLFGFSAGRGTWILQVDTKRTYTAHPRGPVSRISITLS